ncbi:drug/metabolite transporter (DMT)-like permease [Geomicrobium halophilum]|uniref:Drug/metabolite transporter (DMT)-like permease n=1 Tax=Geomicrobium halophilum TaxID=549000 RepID=A0A841Q053_9BACL|nr:hypothetical protein [Geomicrobium halophilum]MBB6448628.1 drug/metabolite transporter (DMT)-like permease [Geomicrobium halophilum]
MGKTLSLGTLFGILLVLSGIAVVNMKDIKQLRRKVDYDHAIPDQKEKGSL